MNHVPLSQPSLPSLDGEESKSILHVLTSLPNEFKDQSSTHSTKDLKRCRECDLDRMGKELLQHFDMKRLAQLKRKIQRTGLVLARHAEENVLQKYHAKIGTQGRKTITPRKLHMYVIRINKAGDITESKPCTHCCEMMKNYGIRKVTYSTKEGVLVTESLATMKTTSSVGYRSVEHVMAILDEILANPPIT